ncbi:MAG: transposase [Parvibaculaceae bacterium]|jgi:transposase
MMRDKPERHTDAADRTVKDIRRKTRKRYSSEDKIRVVLAGFRGEDTIAELRLLKKSMIGDGEDIE